MFSRESFQGALSRANLEILMWKQFTYLLPEKVEWFATLFDIDKELLRDCAISQYAIVRKL